MDKKLYVNISPHIRSGNTTSGIMLDVIIALVPALIAAVYYFGVRALYLTAVCVLSSVLFELAFCLIVKKEPSISDLSAVVTGMLLALNLPVGVPEWQAVVGTFVAIVCVKQLFGGIGHNFVNPAIVARIVMLVSFSQSSMTEWVKPQSDLVASATPLDMLYSGKTEGLPSVFDMIMGNRAGSIGETCALAFVFGFVYLVYRRVISWHTPVIFVGTVFVLSLVFTGDLTVSVYHLFPGVR